MKYLQLGFVEGVVSEQSLKHTSVLAAVPKPQALVERLRYGFQGGC